MDPLTMFHRGEFNVLGSAFNRYHLKILSFDLELYNVLMNKNLYLNHVRTMIDELLLSRV